MRSETLKILLVDDEPAHAEALRRILKKADPRIEVRVAGTLAKFRLLATADPPDIAIMDLNLPDGRALEELISPPEDGPFPILLMTGYGDEQIAVSAMKAGAIDYIVKSEEAFAAIPHTIERALREWRLLQDRKSAGEIIQASLREKEVLLREIHHRVKNNMQVISSLFNLQAGHTLNVECREILKEGQNRLRAMSLVHEKLYQSRDLSKIDLPGYIQSLTAHLFHVDLVDPDQVRLETDFEDVVLDINSAIPCGLILNELISNALKHAFPEKRKGILKIRLKRRTDGSVELRVADDGIGFPEGLDFRQAESFGLQIVNLLVGQLNAAFELERGSGTAFTVTFWDMKCPPRT